MPSRQTQKGNRGFCDCRGQDPRTLHWGSPPPPRDFTGREWGHSNRPKNGKPKKSGRFAAASETYMMNFPDKIAGPKQNLVVLTQALFLHPLGRWRYEKWISMRAFHGAAIEPASCLSPLSPPDCFRKPYRAVPTRFPDHRTSCLVQREIARKLGIY